MFDLYFAATSTAELEDYFVKINGNRLFSYAEKPKNKLLKYENDSKIFIDSGAFGVAHSGKQITLDEYINFINETPRGTIFAALDVIPWPEKTVESTEESANKSWENYVYMLEHVKPEYRDKIVPTYHYGEDFKHLKRMLEGYNGYKPPYIAYGGRGGVPTKHLYNSLDTFFDIIKEVRPDVKVHAFGITVISILERYPFTSCDSTSYIQTAINGSVFSEDLKKPVKVSSKIVKDPLHYTHFADNMKEVFLKEVERYGYNVEDLSNDVSARLKFNVDYFMRWQKNYKLKTDKKVKKGSLLGNAKK
jgi:queuine/archaeosine tRNA-ribosyltransferase